MSGGRLGSHGQIEVLGSKAFAEAWAEGRGAAIVRLPTHNEFPRQYTPTRTEP